MAIHPRGDVHEREADQISDQVTRLSAPPPRRASPAGSSGLGQLAASPIVHEVLSSPGQPLDAATRGFMEPRFGQDFSGLRVHTDAKAAESARDVGAAAYTVGRQVVFGAGRYAPGTEEGRRLLAHELAHVAQQAGAATPSLQRQPASDDVAALERELQGKMSERAMLARMLEESQKAAVEDVQNRRVKTGAQREQAKLKAGAQRDLQTQVAEVLKNKIDVIRGKDGFTLRARIELSYPGLKEADGKSTAAADIPRIEKTTREAWTIDMTEGRYAGNKFRLEPRIEFRPNTHPRSDKALQYIVRRDATGDTVADFQRGEVSFNPEHLQGDRVVIAAHELYHLFGFIVDMYYIPDKKVKSGPGAQYSVGRVDVAGRADLLGMVDPKKLREWRDSGVISQAELDRQTRTQAKVWQEDAERILYALGAPPNEPKTAARSDPGSPDFDSSEALRETEAKAQRRLAEIQRATDRYADIADSVKKAERAIQLDQEIAALQKKIAELKARGAKGQTKP